MHEFVDERNCFYDSSSHFKQMWVDEAPLRNVPTSSPKKLCWWSFTHYVTTQHTNMRLDWRVSILVSYLLSCDQMSGVLYACETWSLTQEERRLRKIFRANRNELTEQRRRLHNEELNICAPHQLFLSLSLSLSLCLCSPARAMAFSFTRFLDHTQRRATVGRTPPDEWSARRTDVYLATHKR
jgi:hypothetical protein